MRHSQVYVVPANVLHAAGRANRAIDAHNSRHAVHGLPGRLM